MTEFPLRASQAASWFKCPGFVRMNANVPDVHADHTVREEGAAFHWALLMQHLGHTVTKGVVAPNKVAITEEMIEHIPAYLQRVNAWGDAPSLEMTLPAVRIHPLCGGTCDAWAFDRTARVLHVGDAKFGFRYVDVFENKQLIVYTTAILDYLGLWGDMGVRVNLHIYQPRAYRADGPWFTYEIGMLEFMGLALAVSKAAHATQSPDAPTVTGWQCNECNARVNCQTFADAVAGALEVSGQAVTHDLDARGVETELKRLERAAELIDARKTALAARAEMLLAQGQPMRFYKMGFGRGSTRFNDDVSIEQIKLLGEYFQAKLTKPDEPLTPIQAMKLVPAEVIEAISTRYSGARKLVAVTDNEVRRTFTKG